jgi:26S proteasome regulatory subunit N7
MDLAAEDWAAVKAGIARAKVLCEEGGDWERKNRLKVYEALFCMATRDFKRAAELFLDSIATFTTCGAGIMVFLCRGKW